MRFFNALHFSVRTGSLICAAALLLSADTLVLRNGATVQGTYLGGDARQLRIDQNGTVRSYDIGQVQSVIFSEAGYQPPPPPAQPYPRDARDYAPAPAPNYPAPPPQPVAGITVPADTSVVVRMIDAVNSDTARLGETFRASLAEPIYVNGQEAIPRGADVTTRLVTDQKSGKIEGRTVLTLALSTITINGRPMDVTSSDVQTESSSRGKRSAGVIGGATALGAIVGAIAGGGKGAAIGAGSGAAVGTGAEVLTNGQKVRIPSETRLTFRLQNPIQL
ncbi:MAG TPA: hypothetical protein VGL82_17730 [Bryobacteraceae bacterium]|jgi:hypothetical protein